MPANTRTGKQLLDAMSIVLEDRFEGTTTSLSTQTVLTDTSLTRYNTDALKGQWVLITSGTEDTEERIVTGNNGSTVTVSPGFATAIATSVTYEIHRHQPSQKYRALDRARVVGFPELSQVRFDETLTGDGRGREFPLPATVRRGPYAVFEEVPLEQDPEWNWLLTPGLDALDNNWVLAGAGASRELVVETNDDLLVPKYNTAATKINVPTTTLTTYTQSLGASRAAQAAGRGFFYAQWVYATLSGRVTLELDDDGAPAVSAAHAGFGWELLQVTADIQGNNATALDTRVSVSSAADTMAVILDRAWSGPLERLPDFYEIEHTNPRVVRDGNFQRLMLERAPLAKMQLRIVGRDVLSALGTTTPSTNTMELDEESGDLLAAVAARELLRGLGIGTDSLPTVAAKIALAEERLEELDEEFNAELPREPRLRGPYF